MDKNIKHLPIQIKKLNQKAKIPTHGSDAAAGYDLYACLDQTVYIQPHETKIISTGIAVSIPDNYWGGVYARSGKSIKQGIRPGNCVGVIDPDYRGEVIVALHNDTEATQTIEPHERIAQFILMPYIEMEFTEFENLTETGRGDGGFGSTGTK